MKRNAVWGTGVWARVFTYMGEYEIDCYFDNDRSKIGTLFFDKPVLHPSEIVDWSDYSIWVPAAYYDSVSEQLNSYGLDEETNYKKWSIDYSAMGLLYRFLFTDYEETMSDIRDQMNRISDDRPIILYWGQQAHHDVLYDHDFFDNIIDNNHYKVILVSAKLKSSVGAEDDKEFKKRFTVLKMPMIALHTIYVKEETADDNINEYIKNNKRLQELSVQLQEEKQIYNENGFNIKAYYIEKYINEMLDIIKPAIVMTQGSVLPLYEIIRDFSRQRGIDTVFIHPGVIPGTMALDIDGEVGESLPALYGSSFSELPVDNEDIEKAEDVILFCKRNNYNRKIQPDKRLAKCYTDRINPNKKTVFLAGQNDVCSYMIPPNKRSRSYYSPIFDTSIDAAIFLAGICKKNGLNFIYKPHPDYIKNNAEEILPDNVIYIKEGNLLEIMDMSDIVVTILSATAVDALIREKPVLMLGYNWIKDSGCAYQAFDRDLIENELIGALKCGLTEKMKTAFLGFVARCLKYYVYDNNKEREIRYGRKAPSSIEDIFWLKRLLLGENNECM